MYRRPSTLLLVSAAAVAVMTVTAGCEAKVYGTPPPPSSPPLTVVAPLGSMAPLPEAPPDEPAVAFIGLDDRESGRPPRTPPSPARTSPLPCSTATPANWSPMAEAPSPSPRWSSSSSPTTCYCRCPRARPQLSSDDRAAFDRMLRSSDDSAAETFWNRSGGSAIINRVVARYGLTSTHAPGNGRWFNTISTATDLVRYYDMMLAGTGGLPPEQASLILVNLAQSDADRRPTAWYLAASTPSGSASPKACTPNPSPSSRAGCAASAPTGCTCPPA